MKPDDSNILLKRRHILQRRKRIKYLAESKISFEYEYNKLVVPSTDVHNKRTRCILLIQPIGVGIGRWYYDRLFREFQSFRFEESDGRTIFISPDLLGCGSACQAELISDDRIEPLQQLPLINVKDWSAQIIDLMQKIEDDYKDEGTNNNDIEWCVISNGGCVPIALEIAKKYVDDPNLVKGLLSNLILSATPRINSLLKPQDVEKVQKSYKTLSGTAGNLFWWYSLRNDGQFIQKFSEKNLASKPENLGHEWKPKCVETARAFGGKSRFSTFAFLAGSLNGGNKERLEALRNNKNIKIDVITGGDRRKNPAKSWFWDRRKEKQIQQDRTEVDKEEENTEKVTLVSFLEENGNSAREIVVKGRRCPAHEDAAGFAKTVMKLLRA